jgi:hypothetical protein
MREGRGGREIEKNWVRNKMGRRRSNYDKNEASRRTDN